MIERYTSLIDVVRERAAQHDGRAAYTFLADGEREVARLDHVELDARAKRVATALAEHGARPGDRALLLFPPGLDFIPAFVGCLYAGVIAVPCYPPLPGHESRESSRLAGILSDAGIGIILSTDAVRRGARALSDRMSVLFSAAWIATDTLDGDASAWSAPRLDGSTLAFLQYTSGSTGSPRGVMVSHGNLLHNLECARLAGRNDASTTSVSWLPVIHDMGLIEGVLQPLYAGYSAYLMAPAAFLQRPARWLEAISRYEATNSGGPNFAYDLCTRRITDTERDALDLATWRVAYNGSEPIRAETLAAFHARFASVGFRQEALCPSYGLAESTLLVTTTGRGFAPVTQQVDGELLARGAVVRGEGGKTLVSSGRPQWRTKILIVDPHSHRECADGAIGEIWIDSPSVARGYWRRDSETREVFGAHLADGTGPFLRTGDLGAIRDGELFVTGRLKDIIIVRGLKHYPQDLEFTAEQQDAALRTGCSAAFSLDAEGDETVAIALEFDPRRLPSDPVERDSRLESIAGAVRSAIAQRHGIVLSAVSLVPAGSIPKTTSGKLRRRACRAAFESGALVAAGS